MFDIFLESTGSIIAAVIFCILLRGIRHPCVRAQPGTRQVVIGFGLLLFSFIIDITDNFPSLNGLFVVGDTKYQALLEKVFGMLLGLSFLALGFNRWIPCIQNLASTQESLDFLNQELDQRVKKRTMELERVNRKLTHEAVERKKAEELLKHQAMHDALTALPNRYALRDFLPLEVARATQHDFISAVLLFDLDKFKFINDSLGHEVGDKVLKIVAERLRLCQREADFIGRLGGDEFVLVLSNLGSDQRAATEWVHKQARQIITRLNEPIFLREHRLKITSCIGIKFFPDMQMGTVSDLLKQADIALYHAKNKGQGAFSCFRLDMQESIEKRLDLTRELRVALAQNQLILHYQPLVSLGGQVFGVEALLRWDHPVRGMISPDEFIPMAEEAGIIDKIGLYVLQHTLADWGQYLADGRCDDKCRNDKNCNRKGCNGEFTNEEFSNKECSKNKLKMSVNISPSHFRQGDFVDQIKLLLDDHELHHCQLVLEVTEGVAIQDIDDLSAKMTALQDMGVGISLDDFGTGYSSLAYIKKLPFDTLKIDRSFVRDIHRDSNDAAIVEAILAMATALDIKVIAEGVETEDQYHFLKQRGCMLFQGYYFSRPEPQQVLAARGLFC
jgi:diguanylate cyclase (GGDEF)-like protein